MAIDAAPQKVAATEIGFAAEYFTQETPRSATCVVVATEPILVWDSTELVLILAKQFDEDLFLRIYASIFLFPAWIFRRLYGRTICWLRRCGGTSARMRRKLQRRRHHWHAMAKLRRKLLSSLETVIIGEWQAEWQIRIHWPGEAITDC